MSVFNEQPPLINVKKFSLWLKNNYPFLKTKNFKLLRLNSERDINFLIKFNENKKYVVKISNPKESLKQLEYQDLLIQHLRSNRQLRNLSKILHKKFYFMKITINRVCAVSLLLTYINGNMYAKSKINTSIEKSLGKLLAIQSKQLNSFMHSQAMRIFEWDPQISYGLKIFEFI